MPYEVVGSEVWNVPDPVSGRTYQVFVALPPSYAESPGRRYPVLYVTDADYAFPLARQIGRRLNVEGPKLEEFILVGLSYAVGDDGMTSRRRDYTPTANGPSSAPADAVHGGAGAYITYLKNEALPFVASHYRTNEARRLLLGHSYGALLGTQILFTDPGMFSGYIVGSPSFWYDRNVMARFEKDYARGHGDLAASVYMYVGEYEAPAFGNDADMVADAKQIDAALRARRYPSLRLKLDVLNDEDHLSVAPRGLTHGLKYLLGKTPGSGG
ncbi:MAG: alpha/beta hydrolase [Stenotrophomonas sp.]|uniref:alpha/beta hydrolase n=1 Tax=Stenotrophomonas sp. TaxID=69392 RepID=UPI003D6D6A95